MNRRKQIDLDRLRDELLNRQYDRIEVENCIKDIVIRLSWNESSRCSIYSRSKKRWFHDGIIDKIFIKQQNGGEEWLSLPSDHQLVEDWERRPQVEECNITVVENMRSFYASPWIPAESERDFFFGS